jgi:putative transcriptional regulator
MIKMHLSRLLGEKRMTQSTLARLAGVRPNSINVFYHETIKRIDVDMLDEICRVLRCQPGDLLEYVADQNDDTRSKE